MARRIIGIFLSIIFLFASFQSIAPTSASSMDIVVGIINQPYASDHLLVKLRPEVRLDIDTLATHISSLDRSLASVGAKSFKLLRGSLHTYILEVGVDKDILHAIELLAAEPAVEYAEPDYLAQFAGVPDDPLYSEQWGLAKVQAESAWEQTTGSPSIVIAIIDSGVDLTHEDLAPNLWINPGEIASNGLDDDNNGFLDDTSGWNFVDSNNLVQDTIGHGTLVAGIAAAKSNNSVGIASVCSNCRIMPVKVSQSSGIANYSDIAAGIYYAANKGARVINISLGGYSDSITVMDAINYALSKNIIIVGGAGNDNQSTPFYPAAYEGVIGVAGTDQDDIKVDTSNFGDWVDVSAPGENILSTTLGDYGIDTGTSYAAPFVSGAAGLLLTLHPEWTPAMVRSQFMHTTDELYNLNPSFIGLLGSGRLNIAAAMQSPQPLLIYQSYTGNDISDFRPDFGAEVDLNVTLYNDWADALGVTGTLHSDDPFVTITVAEADFGNVLSGLNQANAVPFRFAIAEDAGYNHTMPFTLALSANGGVYTTSVEFTITTRTSEEPVSGTIEGNIIWTSDKTYKVIGNVGVAPGASLTIEPGTSVQFAGDYSLNVGGTIIALGSVDHPIHFEPYTTGGTWNRILFDDSSLDAQVNDDGVYQSGNVLQSVIVLGAKSGIACLNATAYLSHLRTDRGGINCALGASDLWLMDSDIVGGVNISQGGINPEHLIRSVFRGGSALIPSSEVKDSDFSGGLTIQGYGTVSNTAVGSLVVQGIGDIQQVTSMSTISIGSGQVLDSTVMRGSILAGAASTISKCTLTGGGIVAGAGSNITSNNIQDYIGTGISVSGAGTVTFNRVAGTNQGIEIQAGILENNLVANITGDGLIPGIASIRHNTLIGMEGVGIRLNDIPSAFEYNNFEFNPGDYDVYVSVPSTLKGELLASNNYWGTTDSSVISQRTFDYYDDYTLAKLIALPLLTSPSQTAPGYVRKITLDPASPVGIETVEFKVEFSRSMDVLLQPNITASPFTANAWIMKSQMPTARHELGAGEASNGKIYAIGGLSTYGTVSTVEEYDPVADIWVTKSPMPTARYSLGVVAANNGKVYAIGGSGENAPHLSIVEEYDPVADSWVTKSPMPTGRGEFAVAAASNGKIYAIGGSNRSGLLTSVEEYDPIADIWVTKSPMPTARNMFAAAASNDKIYAIGGFTYGGTWLSTVEEYDPKTDVWTTKSPMPTARYLLSAVAASNGKIYAIGGKDDYGVFSSVEEYDPIKNSWEIKTPMGTSRFAMGAAASTDGRIIAIGGDYIFDINNPFTIILDITEEYKLPDWELVTASKSPRWLTDSQYAVSYDFTSLDPRGDYHLTVENIKDSEGILIVPDNRLTFTVDYAGEISDTTPPSLPNVIAWGDDSLMQLSARAAVNDPESQIVGYRYAIGSTPGGTDVVNWINISASEITHAGLTLMPDQAYYVSFQARNLAGLWSPIGVSNAVVNGASFNYVYLPTVNR
jgi:subtilisin family serine protease